MDNDTLQAAIKLYQDSAAPVVVTNGELDILWSNNRLSESELRSLGERLKISKSLSSDSVEKLRESGSVCVLLPYYPLVTGGVTVTQSGELFIMVVHRDLAPLEGGSFYISSVDRYGNAVRTAIDSLAMSADAAERAVGGDDPELSELFDNIRRGAYRVLRATGAAAMFSKALTGDIKADPRPCDLGELLEGLCDGVKGACRGVKIKLEKPSSPVIAYIDVKFAERALLGVIGNSLTYTRDGNEISVKLARSAGRIIITVKDKGQGIKLEVLPHVCEPYYSREPAADSSYSPSLGLGLTLAAYFCESHGGSLAIDSEFGEGTTVALSISDSAPEGPAETVKAKLPNYVTDRYSGVYIELCELCDIPH